MTGFNSKREAAADKLQEPAQEPVGFMNSGHVYELQQKRITYGYVYPKKEIGASVAVYTTPPQREWVGLTDDEIGYAYIAWDDTDGASFADFARAIEKLLKAKNS